MAEKTEYNIDFPSETIQEGKVQILVPNLKAYGVTPSNYAPSKAPVFYNPVMEFNRDLSVLAFQTYQHLVDHEINICEPLTSQGIRGIRYAAEIDKVSNILLGDISTKACQLAQHNIELNHLENKITLKHSDANHTLCNNASPKKRFDIIDIDPFGTPVPYIDSALRALKNKGLIATTATDLAPLCGVHAKACLRKYGGKPLRTEYCHEIAIRLLCGHIATMAAKQDIGIQILFSHSTDHYIRAYTQISYGAKKADDNLKSMGYIMHCFNCMHRETIQQPFSCPTCQECGTKMDYTGPLWTGPITDTKFVEQIIAQNQKTTFKHHTKITKLLSLINAETTMPPTYYVIDKLSRKLNLPAPANQTFIEALKKSGYQATPTHFNPRGIKTNTPAMVMHQILRELTTTTQPSDLDNKFKQ
ncbi:MAG: tRNA (guanine(10)-N(2))-dimethyltransferase [Nitrososphaerota archaeon]|jgi:tRNA (guanine26-N2/guanine27-N2)-dimethyltransferase|uniref:tRNA (guanine(10)-N(2))-dimethyltransferase n=1 Tax=Candidatus Bathycorpusculum sp. TaxID=2994959 RepID=UPI00283556AE|nr:tRNA (guanine(10)-N(2))-dimethyltransferase [Candidatus Termitimicrobium sp.]MCL2431787.1 tRNA (guanine(10)-N(2))-dimethyltransferase [Candidatus Termitimicrobium sp.]MDR0493388.1 tRNA (guanine(10)-N(2))-dimethyltransferase [Nitrososphaerota archaeon]